MKKIISYIGICLFILFLGFEVKADRIDTINMNIYIDKYGNAHVKEVWKDYFYNDFYFEGCRRYTDLKGAFISDFSVQVDNIEYETISRWNSSDSYKNKAYKAGIKHINDGVELCFGLSNFYKFKNEYTLSYTINGFVFGTNNSDLVYWQFIDKDLGSITKYVNILIYSDFAFNDTIDVLSYGTNYSAHIRDGYIEISNYHYEYDKYLVGLIKFPKDTFDTSNLKGKNFNYYKKMADFDVFICKIRDIISEIGVGSLIAIFIFLFYFVLIIVYVIPVRYAKKDTGSYKFDFGKDGKKLPKTVEMFRDIPCNKDIIRAYWVAYNYGLMDEQTDFLGAILLKWLKQKHIEIRSNTKGSSNNNETSIVFMKRDSFDTSFENTLYNYMYKASKDGILEHHEFSEWCRKNYKKILNWFGEVLDYESEILMDQGMLTRKIKKFKIVYEVNPLMKEEAIKMKGLKKFFNHFENIEDKEAIEVMLWEEFLMYAQIFGVADKVAKQFKRLYPKVITDYDYEIVDFVASVLDSGLSIASVRNESAKKDALNRDDDYSPVDDYSSGGGGYSSGGGGGGSFGGGGGGFR